MSAEYPEGINMTPQMKRIWNDITSTYEFRPCDTEPLVMLCHWYAVAERLMEQMTRKDNVKAPIMQDKDGNPMPNPANSELARARREIESLSALLGIEPNATEKRKKAEVTKLEVIQQRRAERRAAATA